jgi:hypothetical protein
VLEVEGQAVTTRPFLHRGITLRPTGDGWSAITGAVALRVYRHDRRWYWTADVYCGCHLLGWCKRKTRAEALDDAIGMAIAAADRRLHEARTERAALRAIPATGGRRG